MKTYAIAYLRSKHNEREFDAYVETFINTDCIVPDKTTKCYSIEVPVEYYHLIYDGSSVLVSIEDGICKYIPTDQIKEVQLNENYQD